ncbi:hypothetical protein [Steroidobacter denitrificans]|uniref:hypothetical protein n=1 Tax=Steroidobacter denitrificans TaxID=465721 RepID=UPI00082D4B5B|nr:hypothetical protein [Steroidobacter denitrificans]
MSARVGYQMARAVGIVAAHPGCTKRFVAVRLHPAAASGRNNALGYDPINRAISAGLINATYSRGRYSLRAAGRRS